MHSKLDVFLTTSSPGPWSVRKTDHGTYHVLAGTVIVAECSKIWDAELIVFLRESATSIRSLEDQVTYLKERIDILEHPE